MQVSGTVDVPAKLKLSGNVNEVTVSTDEFLISTADASAGTVMDPEKVQNLPLNGRQVYQLIQLVPGARFTQTQFGAGGFSGNRGWDVNNSYSLSGQPGFTNQFLLNGAPISIQGGGGAGSWTHLALGGCGTGVQGHDGHVRRAVRPGGRRHHQRHSQGRHGARAWHGYDFWRKSILGANTYQSNQVGATKSFHNQHQFGGTVCGPITRGGKGFGFFSYESWREVLPAPIVTSVPTPDMLPGPDGSVNLSAYLTAVGKVNGIYDPATNFCAVPSSSGGCSTYSRLPFANNTIPASRISPIGVNILKLFPAPNRPGDVSNYVFNGKDRYTYNMPIGPALPALRRRVFAVPRYNGQRGPAEREFRFWHRLYPAELHPRQQRRVSDCGAAAGHPKWRQRAVAVRAI